MCERVHMHVCWVNEIEQTGTSPLVLVIGRNNWLDTCLSWASLARNDQCSSLHLLAYLCLPPLTTLQGTLKWFWTEHCVVKHGQTRPTWPASLLCGEVPDVLQGWWPCPLQSHWFYVPYTRFRTTSSGTCSWLPGLSSPYWQAESGLTFMQECSYKRLVQSIHDSKPDGVAVTHLSFAIDVDHYFALVSAGLSFLCI